MGFGELRVTVRVNLPHNEYIVSLGESIHKQRMQEKKNTAAVGNYTKVVRQKKKKKKKQLKRATLSVARRQSKRSQDVLVNKQWKKQQEVGKGHETGMNEVTNVFRMSGGSVTYFYPYECAVGPSQWICVLLPNLRMKNNLPHHRHAAGL